MFASPRFPENFTAGSPYRPASTSPAIGRTNESPDQQLPKKAIPPDPAPNKQVAGGDASLC
ncbi:hypothetical protein [Prochlorococcus marinus]|uniref:hypothetical protein n=1 Tax=Prochlorococcus marinus TaxID=1219 RepID=UPI0007B3CE24|nr:hypothetical protein [Prochlorococcus marinus]